MRTETGKWCDCSSLPPLWRPRSARQAAIRSAICAAYGTGWEVLHAHGNAEEAHALVARAAGLSTDPAVRTFLLSNQFFSH
jgi:hypothetical protein